MNGFSVSRQSRSEMSIYDQWAECYDLIDLDRTPMIEFYWGQVGAGARSLLELASGTGTMTIALAQRLRERDGCDRVVGLDSSKAMLRIAAKRAPEIEWVWGDMRAPPMDGEFDFIFCCYNTLHEMVTEDDLSQVFLSVRSLLSAEGVFAFDIYNPDLQYLSAPHVNHVARYTKDTEGREFEVRENTTYDPRTCILNVDWRLIQRGRETEPPLAAINYDFRQYFPEQVNRLLDAAGLIVCNRFGDFDRSPLDENSKKQIVVCAKAS
jgi:SAM-dependent methyltransferase